MKFEFDQSQQEIRSLKRENAAMHKELQICSAMFMNADKTYKGLLFTFRILFEAITYIFNVFFVV